MIRYFHSLYERWEALSFARRLGLIALGGLALRVSWALIMPTAPVSDSHLYWVTSQNLALHGVYGVTPEEPFSYWPVGASALYAGAYKLFGVNFISVQILNIVAGVMLIATTGLLARRWFGEAAGLLAALLIAAWPSLIMFSTVLASEVFLALFVNITLLLWRSDAARWPRYAVAAGAALVAAVYVRPVALLLPVVFLTLDAVSARRLSLRPCLFTLLAVATSSALLAPWVARNYDLHGAIVLVSTNGAPNLWMGNNPDSNGGYMKLPDYTTGMTEIERADVLGDIAVDYMLSNPGRTVVMSARRLIDTHKRETIAVAWNQPALAARFGDGSLLPAKVIASGYWMAVLIAGLAGAALLADKARREAGLFDKLAALAHPALVVWAYYAAVHAIIVGGDRYHFPSIPFIAILAAYGALHVHHVMTRPARAKEGAP